MRLKSFKMWAIPVVLVAVLTLSAPVRADTQFTATLSGTTAGTTSAATGTASLILNTAETEVSYVIEFSGLEAAETMSHFHKAPPGANGGVVFALPLGSPKVGTWAISPEDAAALIAGNIYVNIHSVTFGGGEIRGNLAFDSVAESNYSWGSIKALYQ